MLISKTTITSEPTPMKDYELTLKFKLTMFDGELPANLEKHLQNRLNHWSDGRYEFYTEMLKEGLWKCLTAAALDCIIEECQREFGHEMVQVKPGYTSARWNLEAQKRKPNLPHMHEETDVDIRPRIRD